MLRLFRLLRETDELLINAWRTRRWVTFIRVWLIASVAMVAVAFVIPFIFIYIPFSIYNVVAWVIAAIFGATAKLLATSFSDVFQLALPFGVTVGLVTLIFTPPVMMLKQLSGEFK